MGNRTIRMSDLDLEILMVLYKLSWAQDYHIALMTGEPIKYIRRRLQQLAEGGLVRRVNMVADEPALNVITSKGISEAGFEPRNTTQPSHFSYEHDKGVADTIAYLSILEKSGKYLADFGSVITERDFQSVREMEQVSIRSDGQPIYKTKDADIHAPDAYIIKGNKYIAVEFERTLKTKKSNSQMIDNALDLRKRFDRQFWIYGNNAVRNKLAEIKKDIPEIAMISINDVREYLRIKTSQLPNTISAKTGIPAISRIGHMRDPIPLNKLPLLGSIELESEQNSRKIPHFAENKNAASKLILE